MKPFSLVFLLTLLQGIISTTYAVPKKPEPCGNVVTVNGSVTVKTKQLVPGSPIFPNDEVLTGENSAAKFLMVDKSIIDLGASTSFKFEDYRDGENESRQAELSLEFGTVRASVTKKLDEKSKFHIRTKSSVLAVRGTEFLAKWETKDGKVVEQVTVGSGRVEMNTGGRMLALNPGNQYNASGSIPNTEQGKNTANATTSGAAEEKPALKGEVTTLAPEKLTETLKEAKVEDKTFAETVTFEKRTAKETKKKEEKTSEEAKEKPATSETVAQTKKEEAKEKIKSEEASKNDKGQKAEKTESKSKAENSEKVVEQRKEESQSAVAKAPAEKTDANGTLGAVFQGVTGERLDGKAIVIAKTPDAANIPVAGSPILSKDVDRKPASVSEVDKADPKGEGPVLPPNFYDPNRPTTNIPGSITGNGTTPPAATIPGQITQTINITVKVDGI